MNGSNAYVQMPNALLEGIEDITIIMNVEMDEANVNPTWLYTFGSSTNAGGAVNTTYLGLLNDSSNRLRATISTNRWSNEQNTSKGSA